jgi:hypothetical protein
MNICSKIRRDASKIQNQNPTHVSVDVNKIDAFVVSLTSEAIQSILYHSFDSELHFFDPTDPALTVHFHFVIDTINFCFFNDGTFEYQHLVRGLKAAVLNDRQALSPANLIKMTPLNLRRLLRWESPLPLEEERVRLLKELGHALCSSSPSSSPSSSTDTAAINIVHSAQGSAVKLVEIITSLLPGFRDHTIHPTTGQLFFYKRAQILVGDIWGAFKGQGPGEFKDIDQLTMFADYRVPQILRHLGMLKYSKELGAKVDGKEMMQAGGLEETEIRSGTIHAVEVMKMKIEERLRNEEGGAGGGGGREGGEEERERTGGINSVQLDWWLWEWGEREKDTLKPHHRVMTIYY